MNYNVEIYSVDNPSPTLVWTPPLTATTPRTHTQDLIAAFTDKVATVFRERGRTSITYLEFCRVYRELVLQPDLELAFSPQVHAESQGSPTTAINFELPSKLNPDGSHTQSPLQGRGSKGGEAKEPGPAQTLPTIRSEATLPPL